MINQNNAIGEMLETGQTTLKKAAKQAVGDFAGSVKSQVAGSQTASDSPDQGTNEQGAPAGSSNQQQMTDQERVEFLRDLYGKSGKGSKANPAGNQVGNAQQKSSITQAMGVPQKDPNKEKTPEEIAKIESLRQQLHSDYYQNLVNRPRPKEEPVTEKLEKEKQMAVLEEDKKQKEKPGPLQNVKKGTGETVIGISG